MNPQKIIRSQKFQNQNVFHIILSNFFWEELFFCSVSGSISSEESIFLVAPSYELSDLSTHYGVYMYVCMLSCGNIFYKGNFFMDPQKIIRSQKFQNQNVLHIILSNFFWRDPLVHLHLVHCYTFYSFQMAITPKIS